jgi:ribosomal protein S5
VVFDPPSVFVEEPMVVSTHQDQIGQIGGSTVRPVLSVVGMDEILGPTAGETTTAVPIPELTT